MLSSFPSWTDCVVLDLRKDTWAWDDSYLPDLPTFLDTQGFEYIKKTHEIWVFGGWKSYSEPETREVSTKNISFKSGSW